MVASKKSNGFSLMIFSTLSYQCEPGRACYLKIHFPSGQVSRNAHYQYLSFPWGQPHGKQIRIFRMTLRYDVFGTPPLTVRGRTWQDHQWELRTMSAELQLQSIITCPRCGHRETEIMPVDACQWYYECRGCGALLKPLKGDCCVFCSYGTVPCPPIQLDKKGSCCSHDANCCE